MNGYKREGKQKGGFTMVPMIGRVFGKLRVISKTDIKSKRGILAYNTICECGQEYVADGQKLRKGLITECPLCSKPKGSNHVQWRGVGDISMSWWSDHIIGKNNQRRDARGRKPHDIDITIEYIWDLFLSQNRKCAMTGVLLTFPSRSMKIRSGTASLDRINNKIGYLKGNVQWVHKDINRLKSNFDQDKFIELCELVSKHQLTQIRSN